LSDEEYAAAIFRARGELIDAVNAARHAGLTVNVNTFEVSVERRIVLGTPSRQANAIQPIPHQSGKAGDWLGA
jgi:hypothetical protein